MDHLPHHPLLPLGILLLAGSLAGFAANRLRMPRVTGYVVAGVVFSPSVSGIFAMGQIEMLLAIVANMALAVIAFAIGGSLQLANVRALGKPILWITLTQGLGAMVCAALALSAASFFYPPLLDHGPAAFFSTLLLMGAISAATAPAAVMAVVHELRARGPLTTTLLGVVALDDALTIMIFSGAVSVAGYLLQVGDTDLGLLHGVWEIGGALAMGTLGGLALQYLIPSRQRLEVSMTVVLGAIFLESGTALQFGFSPLLANLCMGFVYVNRRKRSNGLFLQLETIEEPLYCLFFTLAGAHFDIALFNVAALLGITLMLGRFTGKLTGTIVGARISKAPPVIGKYLGITLLPKAGLSLALIFLVRPYLPADLYEVLLNGMLASVIINELVAPPLVKWALGRAGEIGSGERYENT
ncbi:MAG: cation:proton antiporter [Thermodesulfobacteriota bacterium]